jgi:hypothetical protein
MPLVQVMHTRAWRTSGALGAARLGPRVGGAARLGPRVGGAARLGGRALARGGALGALARGGALRGGVRGQWLGLVRWAG